MAKRLADTRQKLQLSRLESQTELLSDDLDLDELSFITRTLPSMRFEEAVISANISRTIEGASTVEIVVNDRYGLIRNSGRLADKVDIKIDGLWFRLVHTGKSGHDLTLTFEDREIAVLRTYDKFRASNWGQLTRSRFAQILVNEVKEFHIPFICPELHKTKFDKDQAEKHKNRKPGFGDWKSAISRAEKRSKPITIKGVAPTSEQLRNVEQVLDEGTRRVLKRKYLVCAIMTIIQEATAYNHGWGDVYGPGDPKFLREKGSVGLFQQQPSWGTFAQRMNPTYASGKFYDKAVPYGESHKQATYSEICQAVQVSAFPQAYASWRIEAERLVTAYGIAGGDTSNDGDTADGNLQRRLEVAANTDNLQFMRGRPKSKVNPKGEKEDSWDCLQRLADEVGWRCFMLSGACYFISEAWLFRSAPSMRISEESEGVDWIDWEYDNSKKKKNAQITITARLDRWAAPPGSIVAVTDTGEVNGRWLVTDIQRSLFDPKATIVCKKPRAKLPEPRRNEISGILDVPGKQMEPPPGYEPRPPGGYPHGKELRDAVLNNQLITFTRDSQRSDIQFGVVKPQLLRFMLAFTDAGFPITVTALKSDHSVNTNSGNVSLHSKGLAVDMGNYQGDTAKVRNAMTWIRNRALQLKIDELIGPVDSLTFGGPYSQATLADHEDHIHVGVFAS